MTKQLLFFITVLTSLSSSAGINLGSWSTFNANQTKYAEKKVALAGMKSSMLTGTFSCALTQTNPNCVETVNYLPGLQSAVAQGQLEPTLFCYTLMLSGNDVTAQYQDDYCNNPGALPSGIVVFPVITNTSNIIGSQTTAANSIVNYSYPSELGNYYAWNVINGTILSGQGTGSISVQWSSQCGIVQVVEFVDGICPAPTVCLEVEINGADCIYPGCIDPSACNYEPQANQDNGSCVFPNYPCDDLNPSTSNDSYNFDCFCEGILDNIAGCTDPSACNFNPSATQDNGTCTFPGCLDPTACNYNSSAGCTDGSCLYLNPASITGNLNPVIGDTVIYSTPFNAGINYSWSVSGGGNVISNDQNTVTVQWNSTGNFTVQLTISNGLCSETSTQSVNVDCNFPAITILGDQGVQNGTTVTFSTGMIINGAYTWVMDAQPAGSAAIVGGLGTNSVQITFGANFTGGTLTITVGDGSCSDSFSLIITDLLEINDNKDVWSIYPNPANEFITISGFETLSGLTYHIMDISGRSVMTGKMMNSQINLGALATSTYILELRSDGLPVARKRFIKK